MTPNPVAALRQVPFFAALPEAQLHQLASTARQKRFAKSAIVLSQGDDTDSMYILVSGRIKVSISDDEGKEVILSMLGPGEFFGEMALIDDHPRSANIETMETTECLVVSKDDFKRFLAANFDMALSFMKELVKRLRAADKKIESLALMDVYGRVARALLDMAEEAPDGRLLIRRKLTKQDIARMIGASREMVSRVMKDLEERGFIEVREDGTTVIKERLNALG